MRREDGSVRLGPDRIIGSLAGDQDGVVSRRQLLTAGIDPGVVTRRVRAGLLVALHRGVYAVGNPRPTPRGRLRAALLAVGGDAVLSHRSAAALHGLASDDIRTVHVSALRHANPRPGLVVHRPLRLPAGERTVAAGLPCTSVARTLVDVAARATRRQLERALDQAEVKRTYDGIAIEAAMRRGRPGAARLRGVVDHHAPGTTITRSPLEERFLVLCRRARLPQPVMNASMVLRDGTAIVVDALLPGVAVELDGRDAHARERAFERDHRRDNELLAVGLLPARFTWRMVTRDQNWVVARLRDHLDLAAALRAGLAN